MPATPPEVSKAMRKLNGLVRDLGVNVTPCCGGGNPCSSVVETVFCPCGTNMSDELITTRNPDGSMTTTKNTSACAATCFNWATLCITGWFCLGIKGCDYCRVQKAKAARLRAQQTSLGAALKVAQVVRESVAETDPLAGKFNAKALLAAAKRSAKELKNMISEYATAHGGWKRRGGAKSSEKEQPLI